MQLRQSLFCLALALTPALASSAFADNRYVSKSGTDSPTCGTNSATACLTIGTALTNASTAGGYNRIIIISSGGFQEAITITSSTELNTANDVLAFIAPPAGQTAITINAGVNDSVRMFNIYLAGSSGAALDAIRFNSGANLEIHNGQIRGFGGVTINFKPSGGTSANLLIDRTEIADATAQCVLLQPNAMQVSAVVNNSLIHNCGTLGLRSDSTLLSSGFVKAHIVNSRIFNIGASAVSAFSGFAGGNARVWVEDSDLVNAVTGGVSNGSLATLVLNRATVAGSTTGLSAAASGQIFSYGNSALQFNSTAGTLPTGVTQQ